MTRRGIVKGVAVEGNSWIVYLFSAKPLTDELYLFDAVIWALMGLPGVVGLLYQNAALLGMSVGGFLALGGHHIQGGLKWRLLLSGKPLPTKSSLTAWEKFCGWFGYNW